MRRIDVGPASVLFLVLSVPAVAGAQLAASSSDLSLREGVSVGAILASTWVGRLEVWPAARLSIPLGRRVGFDVEAGRMFPSTSANFSTAHFYAVQFRLSRVPRNAGGWKPYWIVGSTHIAGIAFDDDGSVTNPHQHVSAIRIGYGGDHTFSNGWRLANEGGLIGGGSDSPTGFFWNLMVAWGPRR